MRASLNANALGVCLDSRALQIAAKGETMKRITVHYYYVLVPDGTQSVHDTLTQLLTLPLDQRLRQCGAHRVRLDDVFPLAQPDNSVNWHLKFSKFRDDNWPGVSALALPAKDLELNQDESLSEETLVVFSTRDNRLVIQYNHFGVRASSVKEYLNQALNNPVGYSLTPVLTNEALAKYQAKSIVTAVEATIEGISEADIALMNGSGLEAAIAKSVEAKVNRFEFKFSVDARVKTNKVDRPWVMRIVDNIRNRGGDNDCLKVSAKANQEDAVEVIDLLESKKVTTFDADAIDRTAGRRYDSSQLFALLDQSMRDWQ